MNTPTRRYGLPLSLAWLGLCLAAAPADAQPITRQRVATISSPLFAAAPPSDPGHLYIVRQSGRIEVLDLATNTLNTTPFLASLPGLVSGGEAGLLGLAFDPNYAANGYFYIYYTVNGARLVERRTRSAADPLVSDPASAFAVLPLTAPVANHNGGWLGFGLDGYLYISVGERGLSSNAQDITDNLFGKILRIDPSGDDFPADTARNYRIPPTNPFVGITGDDEIWCYGLRNPWRCSIDSANGDLYIADVGSATWEEVNVIPAGVGGQNFGWGCREGFAPVGSCPDSPAYTPPLFVYGHTAVVGPLYQTGIAIIGGPVYRGAAIPSLQGRYLFSDHSRDWLIGARIQNGAVVSVANYTCELNLTGFNSILGYGTDAAGEVYICSSSGVDKIIPDTSPQAPDCNSNGRRDLCDIGSMESYDLNQDSIPDECRCPEDWDGDGVFEPADVAAFITRWSTGAASNNLAGDADHNGRTEPADVAHFVNRWFAALQGGDC